MIRLFGFLTGVLVTGTALLLFADETAWESARQGLERVTGVPGASAPLSAQARPFAATPRPADLRAGSDRAGSADAVTAAGAAPPPADPPEVTAPSPSGDLSAALEPAPDDSPPDAADGFAGPSPESGPASGPTAVDAAEPAGARSAADEGPAPAAPAAESAQAAAPADTTGSGQWQAFWTPFRSQASAQGFANHLGAATGQEIRVLRMGPGEYRVAFFHSGDDERRQQLALLEQASGLRLGGEL